MYITTCETDEQVHLFELFHLCETGHSKPVQWDNPEEWDGEGGGREVQVQGTHVHPWLIHVSVWQNPPQYCKVISLQLK